MKCDIKSKKDKNMNMTAHYEKTVKDHSLLNPIEQSNTSQPLCEFTTPKRHEPSNDSFHKQNLNSNSNSNLKHIYHLLSSEKNRRESTLTCSDPCTNSECRCRIIDDLLKKFSPNNYPIHSPRSFEQYLDSFSKERINVLKLLVNNKTTSHSQSQSPTCCDFHNENITETGNMIQSDRSKSSVKSISFSESVYPAKKNLLKEFEGDANSVSEVSILDKEKKSIDTNIELWNQASLHEISIASPEKNNIISIPACIPTFDGNHSSTKKKIFDCSETKSQRQSMSILHTSHKKEMRRFRKSTDQLSYLKEVYKTNKDWSKEVISQISCAIHLCENKVYKWLWDQKNKELYRKGKFLIHHSHP